MCNNIFNADGIGKRQNPADDGILCRSSRICNLFIANCKRTSITRILRINILPELRLNYAQTDLRLRSDGDN